jgi:tetratricopeptide (TPR) repeat protein
MHPAGIYVSREERHLVALRTDLEGENPYEIIYHEYTHALFRLNFRDLPLWMDEGYAVFLGNTHIGDKEVQIGQIPRGDLETLRTNKLIPLETFFQVDHNSPYYNEQNRTSVFYAQSWALVHYLMLDPDAAKRQLRANFLGAYSASDNQIEAAQKTFGDLKKFSQVMEAYAHQDRFYVGHLKLAVHDDPKTYPSRSLPVAETQALRAMFLAYTQRPAEAKAALDEALAADPNFPVVHEALGVFAFYSNHDLRTAASEFDKAVPQTPPNYVPYYFSAMLRSRTRTGASDTADALADLDKVIQMNPKFAPAYAVAANLYSRTPKQYEKAISMGKQAVALDPANLNYAIGYGLVLVNIGKTSDAKQIAAQLAKAVYTPQEKASLQGLNFAISQRESFDHLVAARNTPTAAPLPESPSSSTSSAESSTTHAPREHTSNSFLEGTILRMDCTPGDASRLVLEVDKAPLKFRAGDLTEVEMTSAATGNDDGVPPCSDWKGHHVKVSFRQVPNKDYAGDLLAIEFY